MSDGAIVLTGGETMRQVVPLGIERFGPVIAADSGLDLAERLGLEPGVVVGDLDSVSDGALRRAVERGATVEPSPTDKDLTDLELAVARARAAGARRLVVLGGAGGRLDHLLANVAVLCGPMTEAMQVEAWIGTTRVSVVRDRVEVDGAPGDVVSLLAWHGDATGVTTTGLRWPLTDAVLPAGAALGTSNVFEGDRAAVSLRSGVATLIQPDAPVGSGRVVELATEAVR